MNLLAEATYVLCALTAALCAALLLRAFFATRVRLLAWSGACFVALTLENVLLFFDKVVVPDIDLAPVRATLSLVAVLLIGFGLIWDSRSS